jgi:hypothetical protein
MQLFLFNFYIYLLIIDNYLFTFINQVYFLFYFEQSINLFNLSVFDINSLLILTIIIVDFYLIIIYHVFKKEFDLNIF